MLIRDNIYVLYAYKLIRLTKSAGARMDFHTPMVTLIFFFSSLSAHLNWSKSITKIEILLFDFIG